MWACERAGHPVGIYTTPSLAVEVVAVVGSTYLADATHLPGRRRLTRRPQQIGRDRQIARNPQRPAVPLWVGDILRAPDCSLEVKIRGLWVSTQTSCVTCSRIAGATAAGPGLYSRCAEVAAHRGAPLPSAPWDQALAVGSETRRRSVARARL